MTLNINLDRVKNTLLELSHIGFNVDDNGIYRSGLSPADMAARHWLMGILEKEELSPHMDGAANVFGRFGD
ncbi:MAG: Zn-dependent hydrolase, partial [Gammaproteobacteria bacterium]